MKASEKLKIDELRQELEQHFGRELSPRMRTSFAKFALENFADFAAFEKACELVCANEVTYGCFPTFPRFQELYREWRATNTGAYAEHKTLPAVQPENGYSYRCLCCLDNGLIPNYLLQRYLNINDNNISPYPYRCQRCNAGLQIDGLYCRNVLKEECDRIHDEEIQLRRSAPNDIARLKAKIQVAGFLKRPEFRKEAIEEATLKGIDFALLGLDDPIPTIG